LDYRKKIHALSAAVLTFFFISTASVSCSKPEPVLLLGRTMGTSYSIKIADRLKPGESAAGVQDEIDELLKKINLQMSTYIPESEISRFNKMQSTEPFKVSRDFINVLSLSLDIYKESGSAFDVTIGPLTVCCNLKTLDSVQSCVYGCSYCTIQTFYSDQITLEDELNEKLAGLELDPGRGYHIGTGQSSDALAYGNRNGMLDALCDFAEKNPNVLLEFKTKSSNVDYFVQNKVPANIVCSWSLNPQIIIDNEEHFTSSLQERLQAARTAADNGVKVSFHFHPIIYYKGWQSAYEQIAAKVIEMYTPQEVLFVSFGSLTFIKPVIKKIRALGLPSKILQMEFAEDPHGKLTYPDAVKIEKFSAMHKAFLPWHDKVFFYLCMEKASIWQESLDFVYDSNSQFEEDLLDKSFAKINLQL